MRNLQVRYKLDQGAQIKLLEGDLREEARKRIDEITMKKCKWGENLCCVHCQRRGEIIDLLKHVQEESVLISFQFRCQR